jgi:serine/threonine protein kinase/WD40 repeat protein
MKPGAENQREPAPGHERAAMVERLFLECIELKPEQRRAHVLAHCGTDAALADEVMGLLAHADDEASDGFLSSRVAPGRGLMTELGAKALVGDEPLLPPDRRIAGFTLVGLLGSGGMGAVYLADQERPRRPVALKLMRRTLGASHSSPAYARLLRRFEHEADVLARLKHPGIAQIYEAGTFELDGLRHPYIAMELVRGLSLTQHVREKHLSIRERCLLLAKVCDAVTHAHRNGIIHRDLKPANIIVDEHAEPKILDFGVARADNAQVQMTSVHTGIGQLVGTLPYMSPEQVQGTEGIDSRSDVYALGVLLYELLAACLPYDVRNCSLPEAARIIRDQEPRRLSTISRVFRGDLEIITLKALSKDRERRYQNAEDLGADLRRFVSGEAIAVRRDSALYVLRKQIERHRGLSIVTACVAVVIIGLGIFSAVQAITASRLARSEGLAKTEALNSLEQARHERARADEAAIRATRELARSQVEQGRLQAIAGNATTAEMLIWPEHLRNPESRYTFYALWELYMNQPVLATFANASTDGFAIATRPGRSVPSGGAAFVAGNNAGHLRGFADDFSRVIWSVRAHERALTATTFAGGASLVVTGDAEGLLRVWRSSDGSHVRDLSLAGASIRKIIEVPMPTGDDPSRSAVMCLLDENELRVIDLEDGREVAIWRGDARRVVDITQHPDGASVLVALQGGVIVRSDLQGRELGRVRSDEAVDINRVAISPDGTMLAAGLGMNGVRVLDSATGAVISRIPIGISSVQTLTFTDDSRRLVAGSWWGVSVDDPRTGQRLQRVTTETSTRGGAFIAGTTHFVTLCEDAVRVMDLSERPGRTLNTDAESLAVVAFSPDGAATAISDARGMVRMYDTHTGALRRTLSDAPINARPRGLHFDPTGRWLIRTTMNHLVSVWDLHAEPGTVAARAQAGPATRMQSRTPRSFDFSPDGSLIATAAWGSRGPRFAVLRTGDWSELRSWATNGSEPMAVSFAPDGRRLAVAERSGVIRIVDAQSGAVLDTIRTDATPWVVRFSPDGRRVVWGNWTRKLFVYDVSERRVTRELTGHSALIIDIDFRPGEPTIFASAATDGVVKLWDIEGEGEPSLLTIPASISGEITSIAFCPGAAGLPMLAIAGSNPGAGNVTTGEVQFWNLRYFNRHIAGALQHRFETGDPLVVGTPNEAALREQLRLLRQYSGWSPAARSQTGASDHQP